MKFLFWLCFFLVFYTFLGYGILLFVLVQLRRILFGKRPLPPLDKNNLPTLTLVVAAYNEAGILDTKIKNTLELNYPKDRLQLLFVTDGSTDASPEIIGQYPEIRLLHQKERQGKIHAIHRAMKEVTSEIVVFTDANTYLNQDALLKIVAHYTDPTVGAVSGEKRVWVDGITDATAGEGLYWQYESTLKKWDSELYSVVGAAGELFSVRRQLYEDVPPDTILDDFMISMRIAARGYRVVYEPQAYALETPSEDVNEELKRKIRIAAGGIQSILRLKPLLNPVRYPLLSFQYISHRVLRWTITPFLLIVMLVTNGLIVLSSDQMFYQLLLIGQISFYLAALLGWIFEQRKMSVKLLYVPFYFSFMNYAVIAGIFRYFGGKQAAAWEKAKRKNTDLDNSSSPNP